MKAPQRIDPAPGQESVWDYPRPPRIEPATRLVRVEFAGVEIARSARALRVLETAGAPTYYIPSSDLRREHLMPASGGTTWCEWKGVASYFDIVAAGSKARRAAWTYLDPMPNFKELAGHFAFYPAHVNAFLDDEPVVPQPGGFYGGWVTSDIVGPFKGEPGTEGW